MKVDTVLLKVASRCNIDCRYCYIYHSADKGWLNQPGRMSEETIDAVIKRLTELKDSQKHPLSVVLHGGEPLLLGKKLLNKLLLELRVALGTDSRIALQTNGILLTNEIIELLAQTRTRVGVSIDGPLEVNDQFRVDHKGKSTFKQTLNAIEMLRDHPKSDEFFCGTLAVINPTSDVEEVYRFFKSLKVPSLDFLLQDGNHENLPYGKESFYSLEYGQWLSKLWELYINDPEPVPIIVLDNLVLGMFGKKSTKEGSGMTDYGILVIDTDGSFKKNDTLKSSYDGADLFTESWSVHRNSFLEVIESSEYSNYKASQRTNHEICLKCPYLSSCGGGMVLHRWSNDKKYDNPSIYCQDHQHVCQQIMKTFNTLATDIVPDFSQTRHFDQPFTHAWIPQLFPQSANERILDWLECDDHWKLIETDFYCQYEFDLNSKTLPKELSFLNSRDTLSQLETWLQKSFKTNEIFTSEIAVHRLDEGQGIGLHNDCSDTNEVVRLLLQFNRGLVGGELALFNNHLPESICRIIKPIHSTALAFAITQESYHAVHKVEEGSRFTIVYSFRPRNESGNCQSPR